MPKQFDVEVDEKVPARETDGLFTSGPLVRTLIYSAAGFATEVAFSAIHDLKRGKRVRLRTGLWMFPIYALIMPLYEPLHRALEGKATATQRAAVYGAGFLTIEYVTGSLLRSARGEAPWDYSYARFHLNGLIRPDYFFLWGAAGLALEPLHDAPTTRRDNSIFS